MLSFVRGKGEERKRDREKDTERQTEMKKQNRELIFDLYSMTEVEKQDLRLRLCNIGHFISLVMEVGLGECIIHAT